MIATNIKPSLRKAVDDALFESDVDEQEKKYFYLLQLVRLNVGDQENDIAAALQEVAKELEADGRQKDAFEFKQKTCIMLLELTMNPLPPIPKELIESVKADLKKAPLQYKFHLHLCTDVKAVKSLYSDILNLNECHDSTDNLARFATAGSADILVVQGDSNEHIPVFHGASDVADRLRAEGWTEVYTLKTPGGLIVVFAHSRAIFGKIGLII